MTHRSGPAFERHCEHWPALAHPSSAEVIFVKTDTKFTRLTGQLVRRIPSGVLRYPCSRRSGARKEQVCKEGLFICGQGNEEQSRFGHVERALRPLSVLQCNAMQTQERLAGTVSTLVAL